MSRLLICGLRALQLPTKTSPPPPAAFLLHHRFGHNGHGNGNECYGRTLDDLPVPKGCWYAQHSRRQKMYNIWLVAGLVYFGGSLAMALQAFDFLPFPERVIQLKPEDFKRR